MPFFFTCRLLCKISCNTRMLARSCFTISENWATLFCFAYWWSSPCRKKKSWIFYMPPLSKTFCPDPSAKVFIYVTTYGFMTFVPQISRRDHIASKSSKLSGIVALLYGYIHIKFGSYTRSVVCSRHLGNKCPWGTNIMNTSICILFTGNTKHQSQKLFYAEYNSWLIGMY